MSKENPSDDLISSFLILRLLLGLSAVALPVVLLVWGSIIAGQLDILDSISDYYFLRTRDAFVGIIFSIAMFLVVYMGYKKEAFTIGPLAIKDDYLATFAGIAAIGGSISDR